ncbi:MAG: glycosyltransferase family 4 protein [Smithella sp.]|nr:glycosyltransferase family 4 protein [Smithella sp.]
MKPRILFFASASYETLVEKGVSQNLLDREENGFFEKVINIHPIAKKTQTIKLSNISTVIDIGLDFFPGSEKIKLLKYLQIPIHFVRVITIGYATIKKNRIDIVRATDPYDAGFFGWIVSFLTGVPFVVSVHSDFDKRYALDKEKGATRYFGSRSLAKGIERLVIKNADMVMPIRESLVPALVHNGVSADRIRLIPHGIDMRPFKSESKVDVYKHFSIDPARKIISFAGRVSKENYIDDIVALASKLLDRRKDCVVVIAGGGNEEARLKKLCEGELGEIICLLGFQPNAIVADLRKASACSLCLMGGFSLIEACAAGRPVIAYDVEWHSELVKTGETGFLLKENDLKGLLDAALYCLNHKAEADKLGQNAQRIAFEKHDILKTSEIKIKWYQELIDLKT